eukprot:GHVN01025656.1.p1 GENE.GHVN01025656.1~~GHVN01025656.1.p1  ORF type:complete len:155 (+),score=9.21 GHVN01025656.1:573-1037(+)
MPDQIDDILKYAPVLEAEHKRRNSGLLIATGAVSAAPAATSSQPRAPTPTGECHCCGERGHWRKDCRFAKHRCENCHRIGHTQKACNSRTCKDTQGRISQSLRTQPSKVTFEQRLDKSTEDKVTTAQDVFERLREMAKKKESESGSEKGKCSKA